MSTVPAHPFDPSSIARVDQVGIEERAASLGKRSIKKESKRAGIRLAISMIDLTTLEGRIPRGRCASSARRRCGPCPATLPCRTWRRSASTPTSSRWPGRPSKERGQGRLGRDRLSGGPRAAPVKIDDVRRAVAMGADEIDMVIDRGAFLAGDYAKVTNEILAIKDACGEAHLKVILETGELETFDNVRKASHLAMAAGADFIKTSTGKVAPAATPPVVLVMLEAIRDFYLDTGRRIGMKPAGGSRRPSRPCTCSSSSRRRSATPG